MRSKFLKNPLLLASVIHHNSKLFLDEFIESIEAQSLDLFDLLLIVEEGIQLNKRVLNFNRGEIHIERVAISNGAKRNRDVMLSKIYELDYQIIVLQDSDDLLHPDRLEECFSKLDGRNNTVIVSDIVPFYDGKTIKKLKGIWSKRFLFSSGRPNISYNYYGLGNTAFTGDTLILPNINLNIIENIYDWEFFIQLYSKTSFETIFGSKPVYYRQNNNNTLGIYSRNSVDLKQKILAKYKNFNNIESSSISIKTHYKFWFEK